MHLLIFLQPNNIFITAEKVDMIVSAELPDESTTIGQ
jgi:hypothetical protein